MISTRLVNMALITFDQFKNKYLGKQVEYHSYSPGAENQCVDLINQYLTEVLGLDPIIGTHAKDFKNRYNSEQLEWIPNTPNGVPGVGDIIVWNGRVGGGYGHVGIFESGDVNGFVSIDQNWSIPEKVTREKHNYNNVSGWLRPKEQQMPSEGKIEIDKKKFEELVTKSSRWDGVLAVGYTSVAQIEQDIKQLKQAASDAQANERTERERAEKARKELNSLIAIVAKALNTQQEIGQIEASLARVDKSLDELEDLQKQYAALQTNAGEKEEELNAEIKRLEELIKNSNSLAGASFEDLLTEIIRRFKNILQGRSI
jgi:hypothetical protein